MQILHCKFRICCQLLIDWWRKWALAPVAQCKAHRFQVKLLVWLVWHLTALNPWTAKTKRTLKVQTTKSQVVDVQTTKKHWKHVFEMKNNGNLMDMWSQHKFTCSSKFSILCITTLDISHHVKATGIHTVFEGFWHWCWLRRFSPHFQLPKWKHQSGLIFSQCQCCTKLSDHLP